MKVKLKKNEGQRIPSKYALNTTLGTERHRINLPLVLKVQTLFAASDSPTVLSSVGDPDPLVRGTDPDSDPSLFS